MLGFVKYLKISKNNPKLISLKSLISKTSKFLNAKTLHFLSFVISKSGEINLEKIWGHLQNYKPGCGIYVKYKSFKLQDVHPLY